MKKILAAVLAASVVSSFVVSPAFADCAEEIEAVQSAFESSELDEENQGNVAAAIDEALAASESGDEDACMAAIDAAKGILDIQ